MNGTIAIRNKKTPRITGMAYEILYWIVMGLIAIVGGGLVIGWCMLGWIAFVNVRERR